MNKNIDKLIFQLENAFSGTPYFGTPVIKIIEQISFDKANNAINEGHSIAQILAHILVWRNLVIDQINGSDAHDIELGSDKDWPKIIINSEEEWLSLVDEIKQSQIRIIELLKAKDDSWLVTKLNGKVFSYNFMLKGIIQHDIYHIGQVNLLKSI